MRRYSIGGLGISTGAYPYEWGCVSPGGSAEKTSCHTWCKRTASPLHTQSTNFSVTKIISTAKNDRINVTNPKGLVTFGCSHQRVQQNIPVFQNIHPLSNWTTRKCHKKIYKIYENSNWNRANVQINDAWGGQWRQHVWRKSCLVIYNLPEARLWLGQICLFLMSTFQLGQHETTSTNLHKP